MKLVTTTLLILALGFFGTLPAQQDLNLVGSHLDYWGSITGAYLIDRTAFISTRNLGLLIYDLEDLSQPVRVSRNRQFQLSYLGEWDGYLTGLTGDRLVFIDVSNPQDPQLAGMIGANNVASYCFSDTLCFISTYHSEPISDPGYGTLGSVSFSIFGISDVQQPSLRYREEHSWWASPDSNFVDVGFMHMAFERNYLYATNIGGTTNVWDTHEADTLVLVSELNSYGSQGLLIQEEHLFNIQSRSITIYELDDPSLPESIGAISFDYSSGFYLKDTLLYRINYADSTLRILDISDFEEPEQIGTMQLSSRSSGGLVISQDAGIVLTNNGSKAEILDLTDLTEPEVTAELGEPKSIAGIWKFDDLLFTYIDSQGLIISDCSERARPVEVSVIPIRRIRSVIMQDSFAFVAAAREGVYIYDLSEPSEPESIAVITPRLGSIYDVDLFEDALYVACENGIKLYDINNIRSPRVVSTLREEACYELQVLDTLLLARDQVTALVFSIADPFAPRMIAPYERENRERDHAGDMLAIDRTLFVFRIFNPSEDVYPPITDIVDISRPDSARLIGTHYDNSFGTQPGYPLNINGRLGMVFRDALYIYSLHEFHHYSPRTFATYRLQPYSQGVVIFDDEYLYVATPGAIDIYDSRPLGITDVEVSSPAEFALLSAFPNPFNSTITIAFSGQIPPSIEGGRGGLSLKIYDLSGRLVADLLQNSAVTAPPVTEGRITPPTPPAIAGGDRRSVVWDASSVGAGIYFVRLEAGKTHSTQNILLIR